MQIKSFVCKQVFFLGELSIRQHNFLPAGNPEALRAAASSDYDRPVKNGVG